MLCNIKSLPRNSRQNRNMALKMIDPGTLIAAEYIPALVTRCTIVIIGISRLDGSQRKTRHAIASGISLNLKFCFLSENVGIFIKTYQMKYRKSFTGKDQHASTGQCENSWHCLWLKKANHKINILKRNYKYIIKTNQQEY